MQLVLHNFTVVMSKGDIGYGFTESWMPRSWQTFGDTSGLKPTKIRGNGYVVRGFQSYVWTHSTPNAYGHLYVGCTLDAAPQLNLLQPFFFGVMQLSSCFCLDLRSLRIPKPIILNRRNQAHWALHEISAFWNLNSCLSS